MKENLLENYLEYLDEGLATGAADALYGGIRQGGFWSLIIIPGMFAAWRTANSAFSDAVRKCGTFKQGAGRDACVSREKIKALKSKSNILSSSKARCNMQKDKVGCIQKVQIELDKTNLNLRREEEKLRSSLGESLNLNEISVGGIAGGVGGLAAMFIGSAIVDKAIFLTYRSAQALYSSASRKCGPYKEGPERNICMSKIKLSSLLQQKSLLTKVVSSCNKQKDPTKCREKTSDKIEAIDRNIQIERDTITSSTNELNNKRREEEFKRAQKK